eukprot:PhM_4_TR7503/c0_g1_i1/m.84498
MDPRRHVQLDQLADLLCDAFSVPHARRDDVHAILQQPGTSNDDNVDDGESDGNDDDGNVLARLRELQRLEEGGEEAASSRIRTFPSVREEEVEVDRLCCQDDDDDGESDADDDYSDQQHRYMPTPPSAKHQQQQPNNGHDEEAEQEGHQNTPTTSSPCSSTHVHTYTNANVSAHNRVSMGVDLVTKLSEAKGSNVKVTIHDLRRHLRDRVAMFEATDENSSFKSGNGKKHSTAPRPVPVPSSSFREQYKVKQQGPPCASSVRGERVSVSAPVPAPRRPL